MKSFFNFLIERFEMKILSLNNHKVDNQNSMNAKL